MSGKNVKRIKRAVRKQKNVVAHEFLNFINCMEFLDRVKFAWRVVRARV